MHHDAVAPSPTLFHCLPVTVECTMHDHTSLAELPDLFRFNDGSRVRSEADWRRRREEIAATVLPLEYGGMPPAPSSVRVEPLHTNRPRAFPDTEYTQYRLVHADAPSLHFRLDVHLPQSDRPVPVVLTGDGCWLNLTDEIRREILSRGFAVAVFSRTAIVPDVYTSDRSTGLYLVHPDLQFGAIAAWAWGYHRAIDALEQMEKVDATRVAVVGHSRGGKTALLAGATDERILVTAPNGSGTGGTGSFLFQGPDCERLSDGIRMVPYWYGPDLPGYVDREPELGFDQHFLIAMVAPRAFVNTNGREDFWSNPMGTWQVHRAAREVYRLLGADKRIGHWYRPGGHEHGRADWNAFLDFAELQMSGKPADVSFDDDPYPGLEPAHSWSAHMGAG